MPDGDLPLRSQGFRGLDAERPPHGHDASERTHGGHAKEIGGVHPKASRRNWEAAAREEHDRDQEAGSRDNACTDLEQYSRKNRRYDPAFIRAERHPHPDLTGAA